MKLECKLTVEDDGIFRLELPEVWKDSRLFELLHSKLDEVQPGFGQKMVTEVWAKLAHWPKVEDERQEEGMRLVINFH